MGVRCEAGLSTRTALDAHRRQLRSLETGAKFPTFGEYEDAVEQAVETCLRFRTAVSTDADDLVAKAIGRSRWMVLDECLDELAQSWL